VHVKLKEAGDVNICQLSGEITIDTAQDLKKKFKELLQHKPHKVIINMNEVEYIDSYGLTTLIDLSEHLRSTHGNIALSNLSPKVLSIFEITKLEKAFVIFETEELALKDFSK